MYTTENDGTITAVVNGCYDCPFRVVLPDRCVLLNKEFGTGKVLEYGVKRLEDCPLPKHIVVRVVPHSYSRKEEGDEEKLKGNPAVCQVLIEYEKVYGRKKARELFDHLISELVKILEEVRNGRLSEKR